MRGVKAPDAREARLMNYFNKQDDFWAFREWPPWVQQEMIKDHKKGRERYKLFLFFVFNGLSPFTAQMWIIMQDYKGRFIEGIYDRDGWAHFAQLLRLALNGDLVKNRKPRVWVENTQKWEGGMFDMILGRVD